MAKTRPNDEGGDGAEDRRDDGNGAGAGNVRDGHPRDGGRQGNRAKPRVLGAEELDAQTRIDLIEGAHDLPGKFPVVVIAARDAEFHAMLMATVAAEQGDDPFTVSERRSRAGNYIAYRLELHVADGRIALSRKAVIGNLPGVVALL